MELSLSSFTVRSAANSLAQKLYNWSTLNNRVFKRLGFVVANSECVPPTPSVNQTKSSIFTLKSRLKPTLFFLPPTRLPSFCISPDPAQIHWCSRLSSPDIELEAVSRRRCEAVANCEAGAVERVLKLTHDQLVLYAEQGPRPSASRALSQARHPSTPHYVALTDICSIMALRFRAYVP